MHWSEPAHGDQAAPDFRLQVAGGGAVTRAQFRHRQHLILVFLPAGGAADYLLVFAARADEFAGASAVLFGVTSGRALDDRSLPLLLDPADQVRQRYLAALPAPQRPSPDEPLIAVVDRYGVLAYLGGGAGSPADAVDETLTHLWGIEYECPE